jgi:molybdopterin molybdotransferase
MIELNEAHSHVMAGVSPLSPEVVSLDRALGRVLADDITSDIDMPPFRKSAMDGYACRLGDLPGPLEVRGFIGAGQTAESPVEAGACIKIMTGAPVPDGADVVVPVEDVTLSEDGATVMGPPEYEPSNIVLKAEDVRRGQVVLSRGTTVHPQHIAVLCAVGCTEVPVFRHPKVAVLATGDELVEPDRQPGPAGIRNSNSHQLMAQLSRRGLEGTYLGIAVDTERALDDVLTRAADADVLLVSGGVSAGDLDLVPAALRRAGFELIFEKVAVKPGKPTVFGRSGTSYCFGLPGNPVSTFVIFELLVVPLLYGLMGATHRPLLFRARTQAPFVRSRVEREEWVPVILNEPGVAAYLDYHGSGHIHALTRADGLMNVPIGVGEVPAGSEVTVRLLA